MGAIVLFPRMRKNQNIKSKKNLFEMDKMSRNLKKLINKLPKCSKSRKQTAFLGVLHWKKYLSSK